jgi:hypothetical protein
MYAEPVPPDSPLLLCLRCGHDLTKTGSGRCPECGRDFDPADPASVRTWRRGPQIAIGFGGAVLVPLLKAGGLAAAWHVEFGAHRHAAFFTLLGVGVAFALISAAMAAWNRSWWGRAPLLLAGTLCAWSGLFFASEKYFRVWQSMDDAPAEAFADTAPLGALLGGWLPAGILVALAFAVLLLGVHLKRRG